MVVGVLHFVALTRRVDNDLLVQVEQKAALELIIDFTWRVKGRGLGEILGSELAAMIL